MANILVMEDDDAVRQVISRLLKMQSHTVTAFSDAGPALDTVDFQQIDLIITDLLMPTKGDEALERLQIRGIKLPAIVLSGCELTEKEEDHLFSLGARVCMRKPFKLEPFLAAVQHILN